MIRPRILFVLVAAAALAGCITPASPPPRDSRAPRARCLADPHEGGTRPLFFLFCVESP
jgi:hypothetical protein